MSRQEICWDREVAFLWYQLIKISGNTIEINVETKEPMLMHLQKHTQYF